MTLEQARNKALQILNAFSVNGKPIPDLYNNQIDLKLRLTAFANDAQQELSRTNGRIVRSFDVPVFKKRLSAQDSVGTVSATVGTFTLNATKGNAFTVRVCGDCAVSVSVGGNSVFSERVYPQGGSFVTVHGILDNGSDSPVELTVQSDYDFLYTDAAIFENKFPYDDSIPGVGGMVKPPVPADLVDYVNGKILFNGAPSSAYEITEREILLDDSENGMWRVHYYAQPQEITHSTPGSYLFEIPAQLHDAIPYKMAYLAALDINGVNGSTLSAIKNEYSQLASSAISEPKFQQTAVTDYYGGF